MPNCVKLRRKRRQVCIGDLDELITLQDRQITPSLTSVDATETFTDTNPDVWAMVETVSGETIFDDTNTERDVTHRFTIRFIDGITAETWISFDGDRIDILNVEDYEGRHEFLLLRASNRGVDTNEANRA